MKRIDRLKSIKYRAKSYEHNHWVYGNLLKVPNTFPFIEFSMNLSDKDSYQDWGLAIQSDNDYANIIKIDDSTIGMFTGYLDDNESEIYEGDILEFYSVLYSNFGQFKTCKYRTAISTVLWLEDSFALKQHSYNSHNFEPSKGISYLEKCKETTIRIIGNIYDGINEDQ